jgi:hypothetical protein
VESAIKSGYTGDKSGLQCRLSWALLDSASKWRSIRSKAEHDIGKAIHPLIDERSPSADIFKAALSVNESLGQPLLSHEVTAIAEDHMAFAMAQARKFVRRRG